MASMFNERQQGNFPSTSKEMSRSISKPSHLEEEKLYRKMSKIVLKMMKTMLRVKKTMLKTQEIVLKLLKRCWNYTKSKEVIEKFNK